MEIVPRGKVTADAFTSRYDRIELVLKEHGKVLELGSMPMAYKKVSEDKRPGILSGVGEYSEIIGKCMDPEVDIVHSNNNYSFEHRGKISFYRGARSMGNCKVKANNFRFTVHEFAIAENERGKGYGKEALEATLEYGRIIGKIPIFEVCDMSDAFSFLVDQGIEVWGYPRDIDEYAYLIHPDHVKLMKKSYGLEKHDGSKIKTIKDFAELVREATQEL
ncbi:MAG: hypothetical protein ACE5J7_00010 [Candidatus Aenigmatarchaeota archaeon]